MATSPALPSADGRSDRHGRLVVCDLEEQHHVVGAQGEAATEQLPADCVENRTRGRLQPILWLGDLRASTRVIAVAAGARMAAALSAAFAGGIVSKNVVDDVLAQALLEGGSTTA